MRHSSFLLVLTALAGQAVAAPVQGNVVDRINIKRPAVPFAAFPVKDITTGKDIAPTALMTLPTGVEMTAKQYYEELNKLESALNGKGFSIRNPSQIPIFKAPAAALIDTGNVNVPSHPPRPRPPKDGTPLGQAPASTCVAGSTASFSDFAVKAVDFVFFSASAKLAQKSTGNCDSVVNEADTEMKSRILTRAHNIFQQKINLRAEKSGFWSMQNTFMVGDKVIDNAKSAGQGSQPSGSQGSFPTPIPVTGTYDYAVLNDTLGVLIRYGVAGSVEFNRDVGLSPLNVSLRLNPKISSQITGEGHASLAIAAVNVKSNLSFAHGVIDQKITGRAIVDGGQVYLAGSQSGNMNLQVLKGSFGGDARMVFPLIVPPFYQILSTEFDFGTYAGTPLKSNPFSGNFEAVYKK